MDNKITKILLTNATFVEQINLINADLYECQLKCQLKRLDKIIEYYEYNYEQLMRSNICKTSKKVKRNILGAVLTELRKYKEKLSYKLNGSV